MVDQRPFFLETLAWVDNNTFLFEQHFKATYDLLPPQACACFLPFKQLIRQQMVQFQDSISERLHHHTFSNMLFNMISEAHHVRVFSCSEPRVGTWLTTWPIFPTFWLSSLVFFHSTLYATWITPSFNCRHLSMCVHTSHWPYEYPPPMLCSWQRMHWNLWCNSWHICHHCKKCWLPRGTITITCVSFNHIQLLSLTNQHHVYQKWHLHPSRCCHY
jgi:hypothetical protein